MLVEAACTQETVLSRDAPPFASLDPVPELAAHLLRTLMVFRLGRLSLFRTLKLAASVDDEPAVGLRGAPAAGGESGGGREANGGESNIAQPHAPDA
jgi:hypothetical protein